MNEVAQNQSFTSWRIRKMKIKRFIKTFLPYILLITVLLLVCLYAAHKGKLVGKVSKLKVITPVASASAIEKMKAEQPLRKNIFGDGSPSEKAELEERKKDAAEYLKRLVTNNNSKALSAGTSTSGSELVPTYVSDQIVMQALNYGLIRKYAYKWPM